MYDAVFVLIDAFNKLLRKKPDQFRSPYTSKRGNQPYTNSSGINGSANVNGIVNNNFNTLSGNANNNNRLLDCNIPKGHHPTPWEHGDKISRYLRKVCITFLIYKCAQRKNCSVTQLRICFFLTFLNN